MTHASKSLWRFTKLAFLLGAMVLLPMKLNAQGYINGQAIAPTGKPASYATVRVCPYSGGGGLPCSPLSPLYSDLALTQSVGNPYTTDSYGNFSVAVASSSYIVQVYVSGAVYSYLYTIGSGGSGSGFPIILGSTSIAAGSTTTSIAGLTIDGVTPTVMGYVDPTSSIQTQLNGKQASGTYANCVAGTSANDCLTLNGSGYVPNTNLSAIPNGALANSSITIATTGAATGGGPVALGGSLTVNVGASAIAAQIAVQTGCSSITNTWNPFTNTCIAPSSGIPYPAAGIPNSTGAAWTTSYNGSNQIPASIAPGTPLTAAAVDAVGALTNSTSGTAANLSGTPALPNGTTATTQTNGDSTTELANDAFVQAAISSIPATSISTALQCTAHSASTTAYTCTTSPTFSLVNGNLIFFQPDVNNSGVNPTLSVNGATPGYILNGTGGYVTANQVYASGAIYLLEYVSGNWQIQTVPLGYPSSSVASINTVAGPFTFNFSTGAGSCAGNTCTFTGSSSGGGSVTNFLAPSGNWPAWLVPAVATGTTTPTLSVAASTIPPAAGGTGGDGTGYAYGNGTSPFSYSTTIPVASVTGAISSVTGTAPVNCTTSGSSVNCGLNGITQSGSGASQVDTFAGSVVAGTSVSAPSLPIPVTAYALCNGIADDRLGIIAAFAAAGTQSASTGQATISFPYGRTCLVNSNPNAAVANNAIFTVPPGVGIDGFGTIKIGNGINFAQLFSWGSSAVIIPATFENLTIDFNGANNPMTATPGNTNYRLAFGNNLGGPNGSAGLVFRNLTFKNGNGVWTINTSNTDNAVVDGCHWLNWGVNSSIQYDSSLIYTNGTNGGSSITNNDFTASGPAVRTAIEVHNSNTVVTGNRIYGFGVGIIYDSNPYTLGATTSNINISNNVIYVNSNGIQFWTDKGAIDNLIVANNSVSMDRQGFSTNWASVGSEAGIEWYGNGGGYSLSHAKITGNVITWAPETATFPSPSSLAGIAIIDVTASTAVVIDSDVSNNIVSNSPYACYWFSASAIKGLHIHNNIAANCNMEKLAVPPGQYGSGYTFVVQSGGTVANMLVDHNVVYDTQTTPTTQIGIVWYGAVGDGAPTGAQIVDNSITFSSTSPNSYANFYYSGPLIRVTAPNAFLSGRVNLVSMTSGNYSPIGSTVTDSVTGITYTNTNANGLTWIGAPLNYPTWTSGTPFVKMTAAGTFSLDTNTYGTFTLPSLTSGSVLFSNGSTIAQDNSNFFWDATNHRLGIGTTTPAALLSVGSSSQFQVNSTGVSSAGAGSTDLNGSGVPEAHCLADGTGGCVTLGGELSCSNLVLGSAAGTGATCNAVVGYDGSHYIDFTAGSTGREGGVVFTLTFTSARASSYCTLSPMNQATAAIMTQVFYLPGGGANYALDNASTLLLANGTEYKFTAVCP